MALYQSGGSFLPGQEANITSATPWNFVNAPTFGADTLGSLPSMTSGGFINGPTGLNRLVLNPTAKTIANASATSLFNVARVANSFAGGVIFYSVFATDGTDYQSMTSMVTYALVDKAGTGTFTITEVAGNQAKAVSTGTYTIAWTFVTGTNIGVVKAQPTSSLTATTHTINYTVVPIIGAVTIL